MADRVEVHLLVKTPNGKTYEIGSLLLDPTDLRDGLADALEDAAREIRTDGLADRK
jgi:hypothetical protein